MSVTAAALFDGDGLCQVGGVSRGEPGALDVGAVLADGASAGVDGEDAADAEPGKYNTLIHSYRRCC